MGADSDRAADFSFDDQPSKSSFFSRLKLPLRSRTRNLADFQVGLDEPHRQFQAGDHVTGSVILSVIKPIRITHLTVALHGYIRVYKNAAAAAQLNATNPTVAPDGGSRSFRYYGNGHASLFSDEQVLCGEGRLTARKWEFKFDLILPPKDLPSSIDFERGTIAYVITATMTRPTSISQTTSAETKLSLVEKVDVGLVVPPRERKVTMHAMRRRTRRKKQPVATTTTAVRNSATPETPEPASDIDSIRVNENTNDSSVNLSDPGQAGPDGVLIPRSPIQSDMQSDISADSVPSNNSNSVRGADASCRSAAGSGVSALGIEDREITATVELLKGGCLPGDLLPVRIKVEHNRRMKSMHGIIVTFYRQGRVDYAPPASLFTNLSKEDARRLEREEYYPKSRTGLGGLSLSSAGSCSVFRKDLSQAVAPLIIDPVSLSANITTSVRVPEDVFPSIKGVPGGLISFKYHVEVVVDLGGKLAGQTQGNAPTPGRVGSVSAPGAGSGSAVSPYEGHLNRLANWNGTIVDTDHLRREKGVISVLFEVVVGTMDSNRARGKAVARPTLILQSPSAQELPIDADENNYTWQDGFEETDDYNEIGYSHDQSREYFPPAAASQPSYHDYQGGQPQIPAYIAPPQLPDQSGLSEKERLRQAEQRLLPSQPRSQVSASEPDPSQPLPSTESITGPSNDLPQPSAPVFPSLVIDDDVEAGPSAPPLEALSHSETNPVDDKQELEWRRLLGEASAPPEVPDDYEEGERSSPAINAAGPPSTNPEPSAPILDELDSYGSHYPYEAYEGIAGPLTARPSHRNDHGDEQLPKYER
ncbi:or S-antigen, N-terminal domain-containing protein [Pseudomassariella vexata]|uniref:Or S-antigen, N-terminal domain-domain-containing protein n=1 Tax=Pseudomassariella vexata TaxID=1141098 RepID=A0A1Y2DSN3_9PEZI|nr:or S-antigen, N-terminal domain-containing protein [Pseudomassariella vexata]ORY62136.1 or S-antigen, N-terminal domain-domain-containing protein [Pseudomassariella vexata]